MLYSSLSFLFDYPGKEFGRHSKELNSQILESYPTLLATWLDFQSTVANHGKEEIAAIFVETFDVNDQLTLDIGHLLFGEDKKRNELMVNLQHEFRRFGLDAGIEMPDYLPNLLKLMAHHPDAAFVEELSISLVLPALRILHKRLLPGANPYALLFELLIKVILERYPASVFEEYVPVKNSQRTYSNNYCNHG